MRLPKLRRVVDQMAVDALPDALEDFGRGLDTDIGGDERVFQFVEEIGVDLLPAKKDVFDLGHQAGAGLLNALLQAVEEAQ